MLLGRSKLLSGSFTFSATETYHFFMFLLHIQIMRNTIRFKKQISNVFIVEIVSKKIPVVCSVQFVYETRSDFYCRKCPPKINRCFNYGFAGLRKTQPGPVALPGPVARPGCSAQKTCPLGPI